MPLIMLPVTSKDGLLVAIALRHPTAIMVQCMQVNATLSAGGWLLSLMCVVKTEDNCFRYTDVMCAQYRCWYRSIFSDTDTVNYVVAFSICDWANYTQGKTKLFRKS